MNSDSLFLTERLPFLLICLLAFLIPLRRLYSIGPLSIGGIVGLLAIMTWGCQKIFWSTEIKNIRISPIFYGLFSIFIAWMFLSVTWSIDPLGSIAQTIEYIELFIISIVIFNVVTKIKEIDYLLLAFVAGAAVVSLSIWSNLLIGEQILTGRYTAFDFSLNRTVGHLVLSIPIAWHVYERFSQSYKLVALATMIYIPIGVTAILSTGSRQGMLAIIPFGIYLGYISLKGQMNVQYLVAVALAIIGIFFYSTLELSIARLRTVTETILAGEFGGRGEIWVGGLEAVGNIGIQAVILGFGVGQFGSAVEPIFGTARGAHNTFVEIFVELGLIGLVVFLLLLRDVVSKTRSFTNTSLWFTVLTCLLVISLANEWGSYLMTWFILTVIITRQSIK